MYAEAGCWLVENALVEEAQRQKDLDMWAGIYSQMLDSDN